MDIHLRSQLRKRRASFERLACTGLVVALLVGPGASPAAAQAPAPTSPSVDASLEVQSFDLAPLPWRALFPGRRRHLPYASRPPVDAEGLPMRRWTDGRVYYSPSALTFDGLRRLDAYLGYGDPPYLERVLAIADRLRSLAVWQDGAAWLPFPYDNRHQGLAAPWYNALAQGTALALFARLHRLRGDPADLAMAEGLFHSLSRMGPTAGPWVSRLDRHGHIWFEHYPGGLRGKVLNAHAYVVLGLRDLWQETGGREVRRLLEAGLTTLRAHGEQFRRPGSYSWYNLANRVAHRSYHGFHIRQLHALARASGDPWFGNLARALRRDHEPW